MLGYYGCDGTACDLCPMRQPKGGQAGNGHYGHIWKQPSVHSPSSPSWCQERVLYTLSHNKMLKTAASNPLGRMQCFFRQCKS